MSEQPGWRGAASRLAGRVARAPASRWLIPVYARLFHTQPAQALAPEGGFASLQQFFCRALRPELRPIAGRPEVLVSPADGLVTACGQAELGELFQAKGHAYSLAALLADPHRAGQFAGASYAAIYLAPADYHRVHAPAAGCVREARYVPGSRFSVSPRTAARVPRLFARNERLITYLGTAAGDLALVMVGACLVGGIRVNYDPAWNAGPGPHLPDRRRYQPGYAFHRGQELGRFEFGSTVILLCSAALESRLCIRAGARIRMGEPLMACAVPPETAPAQGC
ncbi:MAG: archaetidylserine decarboxylase [Terriglobales bacterium]